MKIKCVVGCLVLMSALAANASAQLVAGTPEDRLYTQITDANDPGQKIQFALQFVEQFPMSRVLPSVYMMLADLYYAENEPARVIEYGEKAIAIDGNNVNALMTVARALAVARQDIPKAIEYAQRAVDVAAGMRNAPPPPQYTAASWQQYVESTESAARNILSYAQTVR